MEKTSRNGRDVRRLVGQVVFVQPDKSLTCDSAIEFLDTRDYLFLGRVKIVQSDGSIINGDTLFYYRNNRNAILRGNVTLLSEGSTLYTSELTYDMQDGAATYTKGARIVDDKSVLISKEGRFERATNMMYFRKGVELVGENSKLVTDTLDYNTKTRLADFRGPSTLTSPDGVVKTTKGRYNTATEESILEGRSRVDQEDYILIADKIDFNKAKEIGYASGKVWMFSKKDSSIVTGERAIYSGPKGFAKVFDNPLLKSPVDGGDTLYLKADTLLAIGPPNKQGTPLKGFEHIKRRMMAWPKARVFKSNLQAIADSLEYGIEDSTVKFFKDPVLWNNKNQITGDTILVFMKNKALDKAIVRYNSFIVSIDTLGNYNQVKGRNVVAQFDSGGIRRIDVEGNGQSIYWVLDGDSVVNGMNKAVCSDMVIRFGADKKLSKISFIKDPDATLFPPDKVEEPEKKLKGFKWRLSERPTLLSMVGAPEMKKKEVTKEAKKAPKIKISKSPKKRQTKKK